MAGTGVVFYLSTLCSDRKFSEQLAPALFKTMGMSMLAAQLVGGYLFDRCRLNRLLGIGAMTLTIGIGMVWIGDTTAKMQAFAASFGAGQGMLLAVGSAVWGSLLRPNPPGQHTRNDDVLDGRGQRLWAVVVGVVHDTWESLTMQSPHFSSYCAFYRCFPGGQPHHLICELLPKQSV